MKQLKNTLYSILNTYGKTYDIELIENTIYYIMISLIFETNNFSKQLFPNWLQFKTDKKTYNHVYSILKPIILKEQYNAEFLISQVYEYITRLRKGKEKYSIYYTDRWIIKYLSDKTIKNNINKINAIDNIKILEPSCGCGNFLVYVFDILFDWYKNHTFLSDEQIVNKIISNILYAVDIDEKAINLCKTILTIKSLKRSKKEYLNLRFNVYLEDYLQKNIIDEFKYDFIIGNPPYLENRGINKYYNKKYLKDNFVTAVGRFDIYSLFIEKSIKNLKEEGKLAFVLPANLLYNNNFTSARKLILNETQILEIVNLGEKIFNNVDMNMAIIILNKIYSNKIGHKVKCKNIAFSSDKKTDLFKKKYNEIPQEYYNNLLNKVFDIDSSEITFKLRERVYKSYSKRINDYCEIVAGIATGNVKSKLITKENKGSITKRVLEGKDINKYYYTWTGKYINYDKSIIDKKNGEYATFMREEFIYKNKILIRQTADMFICAFDDKGYCLLNTLYSLIIRDKYKKDLDIKYVLALLNSKFYSFLYRTLVREKNKIFPQVKIFHIQYSPLIIPSIGVQNKFTSYVDDIIEKYNKLNRIRKSNLKDDINIYNLQIQIEEIIRIIDLLVYELFNLSKIEIEEVEKEMGESPIDIEKGKKVSEHIIEELKETKDIIKISNRHKINPYDIVKMLVQTNRFHY